MVEDSKRPFPWLVTVISIFCIVTMLVLGFWQLDRKQQKESRLENITVATQSDILKLEDIISAPEDFVDFQVKVSGVALDKLIFVDNKIVDGQIGFHVLQALQTDYGKVIVNLGWKKGDTDRNRLPEVEALQGELTINTILAFPTDNVFIEETNTNYGVFPVLLQQIDLREIALHLGSDILPFVLQASPDSQSGFVRDWQAVVMPPEKHLGYAIQWFGLAIAALTIYLLSLGKYYKQVNPLGQ